MILKTPKGRFSVKVSLWANSSLPELGLINPKIVFKKMISNPIHSDADKGRMTQRQYSDKATVDQIMLLQGDTPYND